MRPLLALAVLAVGVGLAGCGKDDSADQPKVTGKVQEKTPPPGWTPPGDTRPASAGAPPAAGGATKEDGSRG